MRSCVTKRTPGVSADAHALSRARRDPELHTEVRSERQKKTSDRTPWALTFAYRYFRDGRKAGMNPRPPEARPTAPKIERNDLRPRGSRRRYKHCCGGNVVE